MPPCMLRQQVMLALDYDDELPPLVVAMLPDSVQFWNIADDGKLS